jgi:hypothetical protein
MTRISGPGPIAQANQKTLLVYRAGPHPTEGHVHQLYGGAAQDAARALKRPLAKRMFDDGVTDMLEVTGADLQALRSAGLQYEIRDLPK